MSFTVKDVGYMEFDRGYLYPYHYVVHSIKHQIDGNPKDRRTLSQIKSMILG